MPRIREAQSEDIPQSNGSDALQVIDALYNLEMQANLMALQHQRRKERVSRSLSEWAEYWPMALGIVVSLFAPQLREFVEPYRPWGLWVSFPMVALTMRPEMNYQLRDCGPAANDHDVRAIPAGGVAGQGCAQGPRHSLWRNGARSLLPRAVHYGAVAGERRVVASVWEVAAGRSVRNLRSSSILDTLHLSQHKWWSIGFVARFGNIPAAMYSFFRYYSNFAIQ